MGQASTSKVRARKTTKNTQHTRCERVRSEGYKVRSIKNADAKVKRVAGERRELKRKLVEAKPDSTIFSPFYKVTANPIYNYEVQGSPN